jgi:RNA polymerase sigma factor (sigma-70 family)
MDSRALLAELPRLRRYARALTGEHAAADDLVQDTLERAWSRVSQWRPGSDLRAWLFGIMHNLRIDQMRRPSLNTTDLDDEFVEPPSRATQGDGIEFADLAAAVMALPEEQRAVMLLVALEEMRYEEVAQTLNIPVGTVMSRLARGRERLRRLLDERNNVTHMRVVK